MTQQIRIGSSPHDLTIYGSFTKGIYRDAYPIIDPTRLELSQAGKVILISGASRGIGREALAPAFAKAGARAIIVTARKAASLDSTVAGIKRINPSIEVFPVELDISQESSVAAAFKKIAERFPEGVDVLVSNAGLRTAIDQTIAKLDMKKWWDDDLTVNIRGATLLTKYFLNLPSTSKEKLLKKKIVYISSGSAYIIHPGQTAYSFSKIILNQLAAYAHAESNEDIKVQAVAIHPGIFITDLLEEMYNFYALDTNELGGYTVNWATSDEAEFMSGRYFAANWDVNEILERKQEILEKNLLTTKLAGVEDSTPPAKILG